MNKSTEEKLSTYLDGQLEDKRRKSLKKMAKDIGHKVKNDREYTLDLGVDDDGSLTVTTHKN